MTRNITILIAGVCIFGCGKQQNLQEKQIPSDSYVETVTEKIEPLTDIEQDYLYVEGASVIFYAPKAEELSSLAIDQAGIEGLSQAIGDFAYYASIVSDSLQSKQIPAIYTDKRLITLNQESGEVTIDRQADSSPMGMILFDGIDHYQQLPGMQTHLSLLAAVNDFFHDDGVSAIPLLDYFKQAEESGRWHVFSSHSDILNQVGRRVDPSYYSKFGEKITYRAGKYHMSVYAYQKFDLADSLTALICRVPSIYDESAVRLYIWDQYRNKVVDQKLLAENVWNEHWIMVKDSWVQLESEQGTFSFVSRKREARVKDGKRMETDSLSGWKWTGSEFKALSTTGLSLNDYPLKDWKSYQEPKAPTEITIIDEDYVWLPLETGDLTWENIIMALPKPYGIEKEPIENQFNTHQIDTLITISRANLKLKFYQAPDDILLINGEITDGALNLKKGIKVGISKLDFISSFDKLSNYQSIPDLVKVRSKSADRIITYSFRQDTLARIEFTNFIH